MVDLAKLMQKRARLESKLAAATTTLRDAQRRDDTRRKVVLGAALLGAVRSSTAPVGILPALVAGMAERDRALFPEVSAVSAIESEGAIQ
jgi:hypothetical protein